MNTCPKCGAKRIADVGRDGYELFECLSHIYKAGQPLRESDQCLRNQLAAANAEIERLRAENEQLKAKPAQLQRRLDSDGFDPASNPEKYYFS